jgi:ABC-type transport system involved in multi-copper enzyme maturation permease subunit
MEVASMLEMIKAELVKALHKKRFWLLFAIIAVIVPMVQVISAGFLSGRVSSALAESATVTRAISEIASPYSLARNHVGGTLQALLYVLAAIVAVFIVGEDRTYKMWKTILVAQPNRLRVLTAKFLSGMLILLIMIVGGLIGALLFGSISIALGYATTFAGDWGNLIGITALQWLVLAAPLALGFLISWLTVSPAIAVIGVIFMPAILETIVTALMALTVNRITPLTAAFEAQRIQQNIETMRHYFFTPNVGIGSRLLGDTIKGLNLGGSSDTMIPVMDWNQIWASAGVATVYFAIFAGLLVWNFTTRDVHD